MVKRYLTLTVLLSTLLGLSPPAARTQEMTERAIAPPEMLQRLPANTAAVLLMNGQEAWQKFERFQGFEGISQTFGNPPFLPFLTVVASEENELVNPWAQGWGVTAVIPLPPEVDRDLETPGEVATVTLIPLADESAFDTYLGLLDADYENSPIQETYQGVEIRAYPEVEILFDVFDPPELPDIWHDSPEEIEPVKWEDSRQLLPDSLSRPLSKLPGQLRAQGFIEGPMTPTEERDAVAFSKPSLAIARLPDDTVIVARRLDEIKAYLDLPPTTASLTDNPEFQKLLQHPEFPTAVLAVYGDFQQLANLSQTLDDNPPDVPFVLPFASGIPPIGDLYAEAYTSFNALVWADEAGGRLQFRSYYQDPQPEIAARLQNPNRILSRLPGETYMSTNGLYLGQSLLNLVSIVEEIPEIASGLDEVRGGVRQALGLELADLFQWMDGEFAIFVYPPIGGNQDAFFPFLPFEVGIYLETSDRPAAERMLESLDSWILNLTDGLLDISQETIGDQSFVSWNLPLGLEGEMMSQLAYGWVTPETLLMTTGMASVNRLYPQPRISLLDSYNFQTAIAPFPPDRASSAYYNLGAIVSGLRDIWLPVDVGPFDVEPFETTLPLAEEELPPNPVLEVLQSLRSLSLGVSIDEEREQLDIRLVLSPRRS